MNIYSKHKRRQLIRDILAAQDISDQDQLLIELAKKGVTTTQATVSRDLHELMVTKVTIGSGLYKYAVLEDKSKANVTDNLRILFRNFVQSVRGAANLCVVKTAPGYANSVASLLDQLKRAAMLGTVAGDDTVLVVLDNAKNCRALEKELLLLLRE